MFLYTQKSKKTILFAYGIPRALLSNKIVFAFLQKVNNSIATKLWVNLINNCTIFLKQKNSARQNSMTKLFMHFKYENKLKIGREK